MKFNCLLGVAAAALAASAAFGADLDAQKKAPEPAPPPSWWDTVTVTGHLEGGITPNFATPFNNLNFGRLFDDRDGVPLFNQGILTIQRPLDPKATGYDFGFKIQGMVGTDARYTHFLGELDYAVHGRTQLDVVEAYGLVHLPWFTEIGISGFDVKFGQFVTLEGAEVIYAPDNPFYSHSYIFNFGIPLKHTGIMVHTDVTPWLAVHAGVTSGVNTSLGWPGDNNNAASFHGGIGLTFLDGNLTILGTVHAGPENPKQLDPLGVGWPWGVVGGTPAACVCDPNNTWRYLNDILVTWKATENLTFITDANYIRDDGWNPLSITGLSDPVLGTLGTAFGFDPTLIPKRARGVEGYGVAQYAIYKINDLVKIGGRFEVWRDNNNFFVAAYPGHFDFVNLQHGFPWTGIAAPAAVFAPRATTYMELTAGLTITPEVPKNPFITGLIMRPEIRWDTALNNSTPFAGGTKRSQVTFGLDAIVPFTIK